MFVLCHWYNSLEANVEDIFIDKSTLFAFFLNYK